MILREELLRAWWRLANLPKIGRNTLGDIRQQLGDINRLINISQADWLDLGLSAPAYQRWCDDSSLLQGFDQALAWGQNPRCGIILAGQAPYPEALSSLKDAPWMLYYHGDLACLSQPMVAMVGSRKPTPYALHWGQQCARQLAQQGVTVVSGLALGIDGAVHQGALEAANQSGRTVAVLGSGLDVIYPQRHIGLAQMIIGNGLLLSEFAPGTQPQARHFPSRNRIISGLSQATVVVEAALKSGSLITARQAAEQGRDVFALPGEVTNPLTHGCHQLIRDGALLVQSSDDILDELGLNANSQGSLFHSSAPQLQPQAKPAAVAVSKAVASEPVPEPQSVLTPALTPGVDAPELLAHIDFDPTVTDVIAIRSQLPIAQLLPQLLELELDGWLSQGPGGYQRLK